MSTEILTKYFNEIEIIEDIQYQLSIMHPADLEFILGIITPMGEEEENIIWKLLQPQLQENLDTMKK